MGRESISQQGELHLSPYDSQRIERESAGCSVASDSSTPWTVAHRASLSMGFSRQKSGLLFPSPGDLPDPGTDHESPALQADSLPSEPPGKPKKKGGVKTKAKQKTKTKTKTNHRFRVLVFFFFLSKWHFIIQILWCQCTTEKSLPHRVTFISAAASVRGRYRNSGMLKKVHLLSNGARISASFPR